MVSRKNKSAGVLAAVVAGLLWCTFVSAKVIDGLFININGNAVTYSEFRQFVASKLAIHVGDAEDFLRKEQSREKLKDMTNAFIDVKLIQFELEKLGDSVQEEELSEVIERIVSDSGYSAAEFEMALQREGITMSAYRDNLKREMEKSRVIRAVKGKEVLVTDEEAKSFYLENRERFKRNYSVMLTMLSFPLNLPEEKEELIRFREVLSGADSIVDHGGSIDEVRDFLTNRGINSDMTDLGPLPLEDMSREIRTEITGLALGETSRSTIMKDRVVFVKLTERAGGEFVPFDEVKGSIREELVGKRSIRAIREIIQELRSSSYIEVHL
jgi:parvulin-like peptidyl-prolyl isomerase